MWCIQREPPSHRPRHCWNYPEFWWMQSACQKRKSLELTTQDGLNQLGKFHKKKHFFVMGWVAGWQLNHEKIWPLCKSANNTYTYLCSSISEERRKWRRMAAQWRNNVTNSVPVLTKGILRPLKISRTRKGNQHTPLTKPLPNASAEAPWDSALKHRFILLSVC